MDLNEYTEKALRTVNPELSKEGIILNMALGLAGETGEVVDIVKKHIFHGHFLDRDELEEEIGDVMWNLVVLAEAYGVDMEKALEKNIRKLEERYPQGFSEDASINRKR